MWRCQQLSQSKDWKTVQSALSQIGATRSPRHRDRHRSQCRSSAAPPRLLGAAPRLKANKGARGDLSEQLAKARPCHCFQRTDARTSQTIINKAFENSKNLASASAIKS